MSSIAIRDVELLFDRKPLDHMKPVLVETRFGVNQIPSARVVLEGPGNTSAQLWNDCAGDAERCRPGTQVDIAVRPASGRTVLLLGVVSQQTVHWQGRSAEMTLRIKHPLHRLLNTRRSQIFENQSDAQVIRRLLQAQDIQVGALQGMTDQHEQMVQWACSDWHWLRSRLSAHGVWLLPRHNEIECLPPRLSTLTDHTLEARRSSASEAVLLDAEWHFDAEQQPHSLTSACWDIKQQTVSSTVRAVPAAIGRGGLDPAKVEALGSLPWHFVHSVPLSQAEVQAQANAQLTNQYAQALRARFTVMGSVGSMAYQLGQTLELKGFGARFDGAGLISEVRHLWQRGSLRTTVCLGQETLASVQPGVLPRAAGLTVGVVDHHRADEANFYRLRVKVPMLGGESLWARLGAPYASKGAGLCLYPESGDEVVLAFFDEDPRCPVILGAMHNPKNQPPFPPSAGNAEKALVFRQADARQALVFNTQDGSACLEAGAQRLHLHKDIQMSGAEGVAIEGKKISLRAQQQLLAEGKSAATIKGAKIDLSH